LGALIAMTPFVWPDWFGHGGFAGRRIAFGLGCFLAVLLLRLVVLLRGLAAFDVLIHNRSVVGLLPLCSVVLSTTRHVVQMRIREVRGHHLRGVLQSGVQHDSSLESTDGDLLTIAIEFHPVEACGGLVAHLLDKALNYFGGREELVFSLKKLGGFPDLQQRSEQRTLTPKRPLGDRLPIPQLRREVLVALPADRNAQGDLLEFNPAEVGIRDSSFTRAVFKNTFRARYVLREFENLFSIWELTAASFIICKPGQEILVCGVAVDWNFSLHVLAGGRTALLVQ
jgi:hypothetical protein